MQPLMHVSSCMYPPIILVSGPLTLFPRAFKLPCFVIIITDEDPWIGVETSDIDSNICPIVIDYIELFQENSKICYLATQKSSICYYVRINDGTLIQNVVMLPDCSGP